MASLEEFPGHSDLLIVRQTGRIIGAVLNYYYRDTMLPFFAGTVPEAPNATHRVRCRNHVFSVRGSCSQVTA